MKNARSLRGGATFLVRVACFANVACTFTVTSPDADPASVKPVALPARSEQLAPHANSPVPKVGVADTGMGVQTSGVEVAPDAAASQDSGMTVDPSKSKPAHCPSQMLEVSGNYCTDVMHRCIKGGRTHTDEETEEPEPYYCDAYQPGFAKCLDKEDPKHFCIDVFEYPNHEGAIPMVMVSWYEAKRLCEVQGKRLCGDDEWTLACEGPERLPFPYGWARDGAACNIGHLWVQPNDGILGSRTASPTDIQAEVDRLSRRVPSGSMPSCKSPYGVMDMTGNVDEWTKNVTADGKPYQSTFKGGHWISGARNRCRPVTVSHDENTYYYCEGFRCCANPT